MQLLRALVCAALLTVPVGAAAYQPTQPPPAQEEFVPLSQVPPSEQIPAFRGTTGQSGTVACSTGSTRATMTAQVHTKCSVAAACRLHDDAAACRERAVRFKLAPDLFELAFDQVQIDEVNGVPLIGLRPSSMCKRTFGRVSTL